MPAKITEQAQLSCDKGSSPAKLSVTSQQFCKADNKLIATEKDKEAETNIPAFGTCSITQKNCKPQVSTWMDTSAKDTINGSKILTQQSFCTCSQGGKISVSGKGYTENHEVD